MNAGWKTVRLSEIALIGAGNSAPQETDDFSEDGPLFVRTSDVGEVKFGTVVSARDRLSSRGAKGMRLWKSGTILIPKSGASTFVNHRVILGTDAHVSSHLATIAADTAKADPRFLLYYLSTVRAQDLIQDQSYPSLKLPEIGCIEIPLPALGEQKRIVALLDEAFAGIDEAKAKAEEGLSLSKNLFESSLNGMFEVKEGAWVDTQLTDVLEKQPQNGWSPPAANHSSEGTPVLTLSSVTGFAFRPDKVKHTSAKVDRSKNYWVENGDLLITRSNTPELVGHVAIAESITTPTIYPDLIMRMTPKSGHATTEFLYYQLRTSKLRNEITGRAQGANPTMKKISNSAVKTLPISIPSVKIQIQMSAKLKEAEQASDKLRSMYLEKIGALLELKSSLLAKAFAGELTA